MKIIGLTLGIASDKKSRMFRNTLFLAAMVFMFYSVHAVFAHKHEKTDVANFMIDNQGRILQIKFITSKFLTTGRGFPIAEKNVGLLLIHFDTGKELLRFVPDEKEAGDLLSAYPLDSERIVCNFRNDTSRRRIYHTGVWNIRTNAFRLYKDTGSGYTDETSGIHPDESKIISCPYSHRGVFLHDLKGNAKNHIFAEFHIQCPRFSPDGSRFAFFGADNTDNKENGNYMIIQLMNESKIFKVEFKKGKFESLIPFGSVLSWSPSGKYLSGIVDHYFAKEKLYIWKSNGEMLSVISLPFDVVWRWAPVWLPNEKEILIFYEKDGKIIYRSFIF